MISSAVTATHSAAVEFAPQPRLLRAAHEFEAQLMKELLKPMTASSGLDGSDEDSNSTGALGEFAGEALGRAISEHGGFGIADSILHRLSHSGNRPSPPSETGPGPGA